MSVCTLKLATERFYEFSRNITRNATSPRTSLAEGSRENPISFMCSCPPLPSRQCASLSKVRWRCATVPCWDYTSDVWRWITPPSQVRIDIDTTRAVNATTHSRWPCFSSGRCTGLECIAFVGQNIVDVFGDSSPAENTAIQGILWRPDMIALSICCTALTANFYITFCTVPLQHFFVIVLLQS